MLYIITDNKFNITQTIFTEVELDFEVEASEKKFLTRDKSMIDKVKNSHEFKIILNEDNGELLDIKILKTIQEHEEEQKQNPTIVEEVVDEEKMAMAEAIVNLTMELEEIKTQIGGVK